MRILHKFDKIVIKPICQLLAEGWEPIAWGWLKDRSDLDGTSEISYYAGIERILGDSRILTVLQDQGDRRYLHCIETDFYVARKAIVVPEGREHD